MVMMPLISGGSDPCGLRQVASRGAAGLSRRAVRRPTALVGICRPEAAS